MHHGGNMKILLLLTLIFSVSCSAKRVKRAFQAKRFRLCKEIEMKDKKIKTGWACYRICTKYKFLRRHRTKNCKYWKTEMYDLKDLETFKKFRNAKFVLIQESRID